MADGFTVVVVDLRGGAHAPVHEKRLECWVRGRGSWYPNIAGSPFTPPIDATRLDAVAGETLGDKLSVFPTGRDGPEAVVPLGDARSVVVLISEAAVDIWRGSPAEHMQTVYLGS